MLSAGDPVRRLRREHGFQLPLHPLQVTGWLALAVLTAGSFLLLVPALPSNWQPAVLATLSTLILLHFVAHLSAAIVDPAEPALRRTVPQPLPELDRTKHAHAIEEGQCHLCRVLTSGPRTKHCSACNKCVARFDHHCKWLNHCVGARNYPPFLMCVSTAVAAAAFVAILAIADLVLHHTNPNWSANSERNVTVPVQQSSLPSSDAAFLAIVAALGLLAAVTAGLLLHLCFFHIYISFLGLTTYEYIRQQRQTQPSSNETPVQVQERCSTFRHRPVNLHCEERSRTTIFTCTVVEETVTCAEPTPTPPSTPQDCQMCVVVNNAVAPEQQVRARKVKQKWNCCLSVPDSPDSPVEPRCLVSLCKHKVRTKTGFPSMENLPHNRTHGHWSSAKLRVLFRVLGNLGHNRRRHNQTNAPRNNQVVPLPSETPSESPVQTISNLVPAQSLPDSATTATNNVNVRRTVTLPSLPPPQRRRVISDTELANALTILQQQQQRAGNRRPLPQYRRRRRSTNPHRPKTPALSPIRESGLSNPASPSRQNCAVATSCARPF